MAEIVELDEVWTQTRHLNIRDLGRRRGMQTHRYDVRLRRNGLRQGFIQWADKRVGYSFLPLPEPKYVQEADAVALFLTDKWRKAHPHKVPSFKQRRASRIRALLKRPGGGGLDKRYAPVVS